MIAVLFHINTPGPCFDREFATVHEAVAWVQRYQPCGPRSTRRVLGAPIDNDRCATYTQVVGPSGRVKASAVIYTGPVGTA